MSKSNQTLTALEGVKVGHSTHTADLTGCTVVLFDRSLPVSYRCYGGGPSTFNTDSLHDTAAFHRRWGLFIAGGSLTGLTAAGTIITEMVAAGLGDLNAQIINASISGAVVFDLGTHIKQFNPALGTEAFHAATTHPSPSGNVGAGTGTTVGKFHQPSNSIAAMKSGVGSARVDLSDGAFIVAMSVVNALGNVISDTGQVLAGNRKSGGGFAEFSEQTLTKDYSPSSSPLASNTTISIVGTNVDLANQEHYTRVANMATHGHSRAIYPVNTSVDGDTLFVFSTEQHKDYLSSRGTWAPYPYWPPLAVDLIGDAAAKAVRLSIYDACTSAKTIPFKSALDGIIPGLAG